MKRIAVIGNNAVKKMHSGLWRRCKNQKRNNAAGRLKNRLPGNIAIDYAEGYLERYEVKNKGNMGDITINRPVPIDQLDPAQLEQAIEAAKMLTLLLCSAELTAITKQKLPTGAA
ncbi:hypothetical protein LWM68_19670 [Niabella sp. W65]|nr:hypothetical protein [Niabella sp. W65]MCH7364783.1 hypothetical protein [Niabella sp. W65]